jgi:hypothetical protein
MKSLCPWLGSSPFGERLRPASRPIGSGVLASLARLAGDSTAWIRLVRPSLGGAGIGGLQASAPSAGGRTSTPAQASLSSGR